MSEKGESLCQETYMKALKPSLSRLGIEDSMNLWKVSMMYCGGSDNGGRGGRPAEKRFPGILIELGV